jgi:uncharacterized membrane protein SpoIIM required for sporulation
MDLNEFITTCRPRWERLETVVKKVDGHGLRSLDLDEAKQFAELYRLVSSDLVRARSITVNSDLLSYLNDLVARAYAQVYATRRVSLAKIWAFFARDYPRLVRREARPIALAAAVFFSGALFGAAAMAVDEDAGIYLLPKQHLHMDPSERVAELEKQMASGEAMSSDQQAFFSSFLFTHNIQVTFLTFALGLTFGAGTFILLFVNGLYLGSLAANYHADSVATFFYAWILPHGVPELTSILIAGGAGFIIGRALWNPGRRTRMAALKLHASRGVKLILGTTPILVVAGLIEGTISQMHPPLMPYWLKLAFAGLMAVFLVLYLVGAGRDAANSAHQSAAP